jgi:colanic acid biosynthesis glycosyl transferase WcaI
MRVVVLTQYFAPEVGAPQVRLGSLVRELTTLGHDVEVVTAMPNHPVGRIHEGYRGSLYRFEISAGVPLHRVWLYAATGTGVRRLLNYASFSALSAIGLARCRKPDMIFVESPPLTLGPIAWLAAAVWRCPFVFNVADLWPDSAADLGVIDRRSRAYRVLERLESFMYKRAGSVIAVTEGIRNILIG